MKPIRIERSSARLSDASRRESEVLVGIDLGTTNSLVVLHEGEGSRILVDITPSVVTFFRDGKVVVGDTSLGSDDEKVTISSIKRLMGKVDSDLEIFGRLYKPEQISAEVLKYLISRAEEKLGRSIASAVITVPAYFDDAQRNAVKQAASLAHLNVMRLLSEPTAAAIFYGVEDAEEGIYAVFDLGGGTFDVSVLRMQMGVLKVLAVAGDTELGGDDFDAALADKLQIPRQDAKKIKEELCARGSHERLSMDEFDGIVLPLIHKCVEIFKMALADAEVETSELRGIILVGGATRMPIIREAIKHEFDIKVFDGVDPDRIVAFGAALHAYNLQNRVGNLLLDVCPLTLGMETVAGMVLKIIPRNSTIPISKTEELTTSEDNQTGVVIHVVQGEREFVSGCRSLARFEVSGLPPMPRGVPKIHVTFSLDVDGVLSVSAIEEATGRSGEVRVRPGFGLDSGKIRHMFEDAMAHGREDMQARVLAEAKVEAELILAQMKAYLRLRENADVRAWEARLEEVISCNDGEKIKAELDEMKDLLHNSDIKL